MKKQDKLDVVQKAIAETGLCRFDFTYDANYFYYYPLALTDKFVLGQAEDDFLLDGWSIRKISQIKKVARRADTCDEINRLLGLKEKIEKPPVDMTDWRSIFESLKAMDRFIIVEDERNGQFVIGEIRDVRNNKLFFKGFDADGVWDADEDEIPFTQITSISWGTRYVDTWERYLRNRL